MVSTWEKGKSTTAFWRTFFGGEVRAVSPLPCPSSTAGPPSMPAPFLAMHCRSTGPVLSCRDRSDN